MEKHQQGAAVTYAVILLLGLVAFSTCIASEFKRSKAEDVKLDGNLCYIPKSPAFGLGTFACICLSIAQIIGTVVTGTRLCSRGKIIVQQKKQRITIFLTVLSWFCFWLAILLLSVATSMNQAQPYGRGWLDGECYVVKDGVYVGLGGIILANLVLILGSIFASTRLCTDQIEEEKLYHRSASVTVN